MRDTTTVFIVFILIFFLSSCVVLTDKLNLEREKAKYDYKLKLSSYERCIVDCDYLRISNKERCIDWCKDLKEVEDENFISQT